MAKTKRELTPEELEAKKIKKQRRSDRWTKFWAIVVALALVAGVSYFAKGQADKAVEAANAAAEQQQGSDVNTGINTNTNTNTNTTPTPATPATPSGDNSATPATPSGDNSATPADNSGDNGGSETPAATDAATVANVINQAMAAAANAGYTWSRTGNITQLNVPSKDALNKIINGVSEGATVESVVGGFLGAKGNTETLTISAGQTPMNEEGTDTYYHWDHYKIIATSLTADDIQNLSVNGNEYTFVIPACQNPAPGSAGFSRFTNDYVTLDQVNSELAANIKGVSVSEMTATFGPMNVKMTIENGKVTSLHYDYVASVNPLKLKAIVLNINASGDMQVSADYSNFQY
jgi:hypothetical protein